MLFANAHKNFSAIIKKPSDDEVQHLCRQKLASLQNIDLGGGTDTIGPILYKDDHKAANRGHMLNRSDRTLEAYNPYIRDDDKNVVRLRQEKYGPASLIDRRQSKPPITWERNPFTPTWKKRGWFA